MVGGRGAGGEAPAEGNGFSGGGGGRSSSFGDRGGSSGGGKGGWDKPKSADLDDDIPF